MTHQKHLTVHDEVLKKNFMHIHFSIIQLHFFLIIYARCMSSDGLSIFFLSSLLAFFIYRQICNYNFCAVYMEKSGREEEEKPHKNFVRQNAP